MLPVLTAALLSAPTAPVFAAPGDTLFSDNFDDGSLAPWTSSNFFRAGVSNRSGFSASGYGVYTRNDSVTVTSPAFNAAVPGARLDIWVRRGADSFSEDTDTGDDLVLEYLSDTNSWLPLQTYLGSGTNGQIYNDSFTLPPAALHASLALRLRQTGGSGFNYDYWHVDNVRVTELPPADTLRVGSCDDFERGLAGNWTVISSSGYAGVSTATSFSPSNSLFLNGGVVSVISDTVDTSGVDFGDLTLWVRRGSDNFSEYPDNGENLVIEYYADSGTWIPLETFTGGGSAGQSFSRAYDLPAAGRHTGFRLRFSQTDGSGAPYDFWHIDDVCLERSINPLLQVEKSAQLLDDPINGTNNPKAIPGATLLYTIVLRNEGPGAVDNNSLAISDVLPDNTKLFVSTASGDPIVFADGATPSGLSFNYATDISFSNQPGGSAPFNYTPVPDSQGFDTQVTGFRVNPGGIMNAASAGDLPEFSVSVRIQVE